MRSIKDVAGLEMRVVVDKTPNWNDIVKVFPFVETKKGILFAWCDTIFNPSNVDIPPYLIAHEATHFIQHVATGGPELWWQRYLQDPTFRYEQELEAHCVEFQAYSLSHNRAFRKRALVAIADRLAGPLYGGVTKRKSAQELIKRERDRVVANG